MTHYISGYKKFPDLTYDEDCRSYLIARSAPSVDRRFGRKRGTLVLAQARRAAKRVVAFLRIMHLAIVAAKTRRLYRELELRSVGYDPQYDTTMRRCDGAPAGRKD